MPAFSGSFWEIYTKKSERIKQESRRHGIQETGNPTWLEVKADPSKIARYQRWTSSDQRREDDKTDIILGKCLQVLKGDLHNCWK